MPIGPNRPSARPRVEGLGVAVVAAGLWVACASESPILGSDAETDGATETESDQTGGEFTTGEQGEICRFGEPRGDDPWLEISHHGMPVADGATLALECGPQGMFMFPIVPSFGGFEPEGTLVSFLIRMDVPGFNEGPNGHFFERTDWGYYIGCAPLDGNVEFLPLMVADFVADPTELEGQTAQLHIEMDAVDGGIVEFDATVTLTVPESDWTFCQP